METSECLQQFICGLAQRDDHFVQKPILLTTCGHHACRDCILNNNTTKVTCKCGAITERDFSNDKESVAIKSMIKVNLKNILESIATKATEAIRKLKGRFDFIKLLI